MDIQKIQHHDVDEGSKEYFSNVRDIYAKIQLFKTEMKSSRTGNVYIPIRKISYGHFSTVYLAFNVTQKQYVAIKICKSNPKYESAYQEEVNILLEIKKKTQNMNCDSGIVDILDYFIFENTSYDEIQGKDVTRRHYCIVMEVLGHSVLKLIMRYDCNVAVRGMPIAVVKIITKSLLEAVNNLHKAGYIHTDIKPENVVLKYYLPEIDDDTNYELPELLFSKQSEHLFDSKFSTPAFEVRGEELHRQETEDRCEVNGYLQTYAKQSGLSGSFLEIEEKIMVNEDFTESMRNFLETHTVEETGNKMNYKTNGMNIFNVQNLVKEAEKMFRLSCIDNRILEENDSTPLSSYDTLTRKLSVIHNKTNTVDISQLMYDEAQRDLMDNDIVQIQSAQSGFNVFMGKNDNDDLEYYDYKLIEPQQINKETMTITSSMGIDISLSQITTFSQNLSEIYAEKLYYNLFIPSTIKKIASSGLHSRFALANYMQNMGIRKFPFQLPPLISMNDFKCFALTKDRRAVRPVMVNYFRQNKLIPLSPEMFQVKLVDLGNAYEIANHKHSIIQTRNYRAPEVMLGCNYTDTADVFSIACLVFEMLTSKYLFQVRRKPSEHERDYDHLIKIMETVGSSGIKELLDKGMSSYTQYFKDQKLLENIPANVTPISMILIDQYNFDKKTALEIQEFLEPMLRIDHKKRITAEEALKSPWLKDLGDGDYLFTSSGKIIL